VCDTSQRRISDHREHSEAYVPLWGEVAQVRTLGRLLSVLTATLLLTLALGGAADAKGVTWCVRDPIFVIDGRVVQIQDLVPVENAGAAIHFVLRVAPRSVVSWYLPEGETLVGSVTVVTDDAVAPNTPQLFVRGEGPRFPMRVHVSGAGLRTAPYEVQGTSRGITVPIRLTPGS
jgi:hypothetical protein